MAERGVSREWAEHIAKNYVLREKEERERALERALSRAREQSTGLVETAVTLLDHAADESWSTVAGRLNSWGDEELMDVGRARFDSARALSGEASAQEQEDEEEADEFDANIALGEWECEHRFWATRSPWQIRNEKVREVPAWGDDPTETVVLIQHRKRWWAVCGAQTVSDMAPPDTQIPRDAETVWVAYDGEVEIQEIGRYSSFGLNNLDLLLKSTALVRAFNFSDAVKTRFAGRHAMRLRAVPVESFDDFVQAVAGLVVLGADYYQVTIDADCGIVLAWEAYIDDQVASRQSVSDLLVDTPIDRAMFELPPGPYALPESLEYLN